MRLRVWQGLLCGLVLVAGCGDEKKPAAGSTSGPPKQATAGAPRATESPAEAAERLASSDCGQMGELFLQSEKIPNSACKQLLPYFKAAKPLRFRVFGSGAVMGTEDGGQTILALDRSGHFKFVTSFRSPFGNARASFAKDVMNQTIDAIRNDNCDELVAISLTYQQANGKKFCALGPVRHLHAGLNRDFRAQPTFFGGDGAYAFAGIATKPGRYFTLLFTPNERGDYVFVTAAEA